MFPQLNHIDTNVGLHDRLTQHPVQPAQRIRDASAEVDSRHSFLQETSALEKKHQFRVHFQNSPYE